MPRFLLIIVFFFVQVGKFLKAMKDELVTGFLYFVVLAPVAFSSRFIPIRKTDFHAKKSSWEEIGQGKEMTT